MSNTPRQSRPDELFPIVGIGASAGGLEAITRLLSNLPADTGMAYVVVQHLDPTRESLLPVILQKTAKMSVTQAKDDCVIAPNKVYVIPPNTHMVVSGSRLRLFPRPEGIHAMSVNCFLNSLAEERGNKAIAVILSGSASDGSLGIKAIKSEGGLVFAQNEASSGHYGMPQSAAATGTVDFILPPEKIAAELVRLAPQLISNQDSPDFFDDAESLRKVFVLLRRDTGVNFGLYKPSTIKRRMTRRLMLNKIKSLRQYVTLLEKDPEEIQALHAGLLIHVTHFFREPASIALLREKAFPRILKDLPPEATIRAWVPGCSSGEEAYSLAIVLLDYLSEHDRANPIQIFATDISDAALDRARAGAYEEGIHEHVPPRLLRRYFTKTDRGYEIAKRVRDACVFARQDLTKDPPFANVDIISCCNVLIYLAPAVHKEVMQTFHYALRPTGTLLLGKSESVGDCSDLFELTDKKSRLYYKKPFAIRTRFPDRSRVQEPLPRTRHPHQKIPPAPDWPDTDVQKVAERILLSRFAPASVVVNSDLIVLNFSGHVARYLEPVTGKANLNLLKMLPAHAADAMNALLRKAKKQDAPVKGPEMELSDETDRRSRKFTAEAVPFRLPLTGERYFIVLFEEARPLSGPKGALTKRRPSARAEGASIRRLKSELLSTRGYLQTIAEEHEAANEEVKAANEEIVSSNEELQSTNEELQIAK